jgi:hypothetical protein
MARLRVETAPEVTVYDESFVIKAASGATAPLAEFKNSAGTVVGNISLTGRLNITSVASGNIVPATSNTYTLGTVDNVWKDIFVGPGSLYVNGQKVLQDESGVIIVSATVDNNLGLRTSGSGNIELDPTGSGVVSIKGPLVIQAATNITSADGNAVTFGGAINTDTISSKTTNTDLSITANGTGKVYINDSAEVSGNLVVGGNLTVSGTTTTVNSETISLADNLIDLNSNFTTGSPTENAGVRIMRGDSAAVQLRWNEGTDVWEFTNDGSAYNTITPLASPTFTGTVTIPSGASISGFAPLASPALTGTPTAPTAAALTNTTQVATTAFVTTAVGGATITSLDDVADVTITSAASGQFLKWNGTAWVNDAIDLGTDTTGSYVTSLVAGTGVTLTNNSGEGATPTVAVNTTVIAALASPTFTGTPTLPTGTIATTQTAANNSTAVATTAYVDTADALKANLASPTFTGTPTLPTGTIATTQSANNNTTAVATTAFVTTAVAGVAVDFSSDQSVLASSIFG